MLGDVNAISWTEMHLKLADAPAHCLDIARVTRGQSLELDPDSRLWNAFGVMECLWSQLARVDCQCSSPEALPLCHPDAPPLTNISPLTPQQTTQSASNDP